MQSTSSESDVWLTSVQLKGKSGLPAAIKWNTHGSFCCPTVLLAQHSIVPKSISYGSHKKERENLVLQAIKLFCFDVGVSLCSKIHKMMMTFMHISHPANANEPESEHIAAPLNYAWMRALNVLSLDVHYTVLDFEPIMKWNVNMYLIII
jgi:hypothetical protein